MLELNLFVDWSDIVVSYSIYNALEFEYKHLIVWKFWQCDTNNNIKISLSFNGNILVLTLSVLDVYSTGYK